MKGFGKENKFNKKIKSDFKINQSNTQLLNQALILQSKGNISEAKKYYKYLIDQGFEDYRVFANFGLILVSLNKFKEAELSTRKAISLNPNLAMAHCNLGSILINLGKLEEAELSLIQSISLDPNYAVAYSNLGGLLIDLGKLEDAEFYTRKAIKIKPNYAMANCNLGNILKSLGQLKEAELYTRKAISLNPNLAEAHCNLGNILIDHGKLEDAKLSLIRSISINPNLFRSYLSISTLKYEKKDKLLLNKLFSKSFLTNRIKKDQIDIFFARANILHKETKYKESAENLKLANNLKLSIHPSEHNIFIQKSEKLYTKSKKLKVNKKKSINDSQNIFIVGMPRSGSTLVESILSMNNDVNDLGEINIFEKSFIEWEKDNQKNSLNEIYQRKINGYVSEYKITTNKWLYNYQYTGIILKEISNPKIIYCIRNPLDNILSIYRAHFARGNNYSSSLVDCAKIYLDQKNIMKKYQNEFGSKIYELNYDLLVSESQKEIKSLVSWLGWTWNDLYLSPHLSKRSISTRSNVQVRSPINSHSVGGWKNYKEMLQPAIEIISQLYEYQDFNEKKKNNP